MAAAARSPGRTRRDLAGPEAALGAMESAVQGSGPWPPFRLLLLRVAAMLGTLVPQVRAETDAEPADWVGR